MKDPRDPGYGFPSVAPIPNQDRATRPMGGEDLPLRAPLLESTAVYNRNSPLAQLVPFRRKFRYDGV